MALALDTTVMGASANSYASEAEASAWFEALPAFYTYWNTTINQQARYTLLINAARAIDRMGFLGGKTDDDQFLEFPRDGDLELDVKIKQAQYQMIIHQVLYPSFIAGSGGTVATSSVVQDVTSVTIPGVVSVDFETRSSIIASIGDANTVDGSFEAIRALLSDWLAGRGYNFAFEK